jgi:hypothetical protein
VAISHINKRKIKLLKDTGQSPVKNSLKRIQSLASDSPLQCSEAGLKEGCTLELAYKV